MAARSTQVTLDSAAGVEGRFNLRLMNSGLDHGEWTSQPPELIGNLGIWESESNGFATGTEGRATYQLEDVDGNRMGELTLHWDNPFAGSNSYDQSVDPAADPNDASAPGYSIVRLGGGGDNASVTFRLLNGFCEADADGNIICRSA